MRYDHEDLSFDLPDAYEDHSVVMFSAEPSRPGLATNVVLTRDRLAGGETLRRYVDRQLIELGKQLRDLVLLGSEPCDIGGRQAFDMTASWRAPTGVVEQRLLMIALGERVLTLAITAQQKNRAELDAALACVLASLRVQGAPAAPSKKGPAPSIAAPTVSAKTPSDPPSVPASGYATPPPMSSAKPSSPSSGRQRSTMAMAAVHPQTMQPSSSVMPVAGVSGSRAPSPPPPSTPSAAEAAAAAIAAARWGCDAAAVTAYDLALRLPWAMRHHLAMVRGPQAKWVVVATGVGAPLVFDDQPRLQELNHLFRTEHLRLPRGIETTSLADGLLVLLAGPYGFLGCPAFLEAQRPHLARWLTPPHDEAERIFRHHCAPPLVAEREGQWSLDMSVFTARGAIDACRATGDAQHVRTFERKTVVGEGRLRFPYAA